SERRAYGRLVAMSDSNFFPQERYLLELYARYAATALDGATALDEAKRGHEEAEALLELARSLAEANTSAEVAARLADAVPAVVDCDRVSVWVWDPDAEALKCLATSGVEFEEHTTQFEAHETPSIPNQLAAPNAEPVFHGRDSDEPLVREV